MYISIVNNINTLNVYKDNSIRKIIDYKLK